MLVERLMDEPGSRYRAKQLCGDNWRDMYQWDRHQAALTDLIDLLNVNTRMTVLAAGRKFRPTPLWPRPEPMHDQVDTIAGFIQQLTGAEDTEDPLHRDNDPNG